VSLRLPPSRARLALSRVGLRLSDDAVDAHVKDDASEYQEEHDEEDDATDDFHKVSLRKGWNVSSVIMSEAG
jgi:hypothetical protein